MKRPLVLWIVASSICIAGPILGAPLWLTVVLASPFASLAGGYLIEPPKRHVCGWCGRRFRGPYEWVCPDCEWEAIK